MESIEGCRYLQGDPHQLCTKFFFLSDLAFSSKKSKQAKNTPKHVTKVSPSQHVLYMLIDNCDALISDDRALLGSNQGCASTVTKGFLIITSFTI